MVYSSQSIASTALEQSQLNMIGKVCTWIYLELYDGLRKPCPFWKKGKNLDVKNLYGCKETFMFNATRYPFNG